jgi:hypothetical protein
VRTRVGLPSALLLCVSLLAGSCSRSVPGIFPYNARVVDRQGVLTSLASLRGSPVVFVAYVASMPDCRERIRRLVALSDALRNSDVRFAAVDIGFGQGDNFPDVLPDDRGNVLFLNDRYQELRRELKIDITPTTFLVSPGGKIRERIEGFHTWDAPDFHHRVEMFAGGR